MTLRPRELNRATLARQMLLRREALTVTDAVRRIVAIQAQEPASPYIALWNRVAAFDPADLDGAFTEQAVVKASLMRIALHAVVADDYHAFHPAMESTLRPARLNDRRFRIGGLSIAEADALIPHLLEFTARPRTSAQAEAWLGERLAPDAAHAAWWALKTCGPFVHHPGAAPWWFGPRPVFLAPRTPPAAGAPEAFLPTLVRRYLEGFGPASANDVARFGLLTMPRVRAALEALRGELVTLEGPNGTTLFDVPGGARPDADTPAPPRLMAMWDSILLAYADRGRIIPPEYRAHVIRNNGDVLPTLLVDGHVAGIWRAVDGGAIEATAFHRLPDDAWDGLEAEARALVEFLAGREPIVYRRYAHWWSTLPGAEVRLLGR